MNLAIRKLAMLEKNIVEKEERLRIEGFTTDVIDQEFKHRVTNLMNKIRTL